MGILGTIVLIFLIIHLRAFWYEMKFGDSTYGQLRRSGSAQSYTVVMEAAFSQWWYCVALRISDDRAWLFIWLTASGAPFKPWACSTKSTHH